MKRLDLHISVLKQRMLVLQIALPIVFLLGLGSGWLAWGRTAPATPTSVVNIPADVRRYDIPVGDSPAMGAANAAITIVEFSDFQCPFCKQWYDDVLSRLMTDYKDQVRFVYRDFPLTTIHPQAQPAAEAAHCAGEQEAYWQFHNALFSNKYGLTEQAFQQYATELGLNMEAFNTCVSERRYKQTVTDNANFALTVDVQSTPTFFINGLMVVGAQPYDVFKQVIDKELAGEINQ
jgi:protein-disulfide isomerase